MPAWGGEGVRAGDRMGWGAAGGRKEQTGREERVLVQGTLRNCEDSKGEQRLLGTPPAAAKGHGASRVAPGPLEHAAEVAVLRA